MPNQVIITTYSISELEPKARTKAIEQVMEQLRQDMNPDDLKQKLREKLQKAGLGDDLDIEYSLTNCQGDGVAFYGVLDLDIMLNSEDCEPVMPIILAIKQLGLEPVVELTRNSFGYRYSHWNTMNVNIEWDPMEDDSKHAPKLIQMLEDWLQEYIKNVSRNLEAFGYNFLECVIDEQSAIEHATYDGTQFTETGDIFD